MTIKSEDSGNLCGGSCIFGDPVGFSLNSPCACFRDLEPRDAARVRRSILALRAENERLRAITKEARQLVGAYACHACEADAIGHGHGRKECPRDTARKLLRADPTL